MFDSRSRIKAAGFGAWEDTTSVGVWTSRQLHHLALNYDDLDRNRVHTSKDRRSKGHSFIGYFLLSLLFWPLALIMAGFAKDRTAFAPVRDSADSSFVTPP